MLKIEFNPAFTATVRVNTAAIKGEFKVTYAALPPDELDKLDANDWRQAVKRVVVSFEPMEIGGEQLDGSPASLERLIRWPGVGPAMLAAYWQGLWSEAQGN